MRKGTSLIKVIIKGIIASFLIFVLGFGVMFLLYVNWNKANPYSELPGLFSYKAATIGDSILLPIIVGSFIVYNKKININKSQKILKYLITALSGIIGVFIQISWLINDSTVLNWTIPNLHSFNFAGWYHAFFFVFMIVIISLCMINMFFTDRYINKQKLKIDYIAEFLIWFCGLLFLNLHIFDDYNDYTIAIFLCTICYGGLIILFKFFSYNKEIKLAHLPNIVISVVLSYSFANIIILKSIVIHDNILVVLSSLFLCVVFIAPSVKHKKEMFKLFALIIIMIVPLQFLIINASSIIAGSIYMIFLLISFLLIPVLQLIIYRTNNDCDKNDVCGSVTHKNTKTVNDVLPYMIVGVISQISIAFIGLCSTSFLKLSNEDIVNNILGLIISVTIIPYIIRTFSYVIDYEKDDHKDDSKEWRIVNYSMYVLIFLGSIFLILYSLQHSILCTIDTSFYSAFPSLEIVLFTFFGSLAGSLICILKKHKSIISSILVMILSLVSYVSIVFVIVLANNSGIDLWCLLNYRPAIMVVSSLAFTFIISYGFYNNKIFIRNPKFDCAALFETIIILIGTISISFINIVYLTTSLSVINILLFICSTFIASVLIPFILCQNYYCVREKTCKLLKNQSKEGVLQDGFLYGTATIICQLITIVLLPKNDSKNLSEVLESIIFALFFSAMLIIPIRMCIKNNIKHYAMIKREFNKLSIKEQKEESICLNKLKHYLSVQNIVTLFVVFPYSLVTLLVLLADFVSDKEKTLRKVFLPYDE